jgi:hypothetical protein
MSGLDPIFFAAREAACVTGFGVTVCMKNFVVESGDFITTSGIYRMNDHPGREITLIYGDAVPTFQGKKVTFRLIRAAKNPRRG